MYQSRFREALPSDGVMGELARRRPGLYALAVAGAITGFCTLVTAMLAGLLVFLLAALRTVTTIASGGPWPAMQWFVLMLAGAGGAGGAALLAGKWVAQYGGDA